MHLEGPSWFASPTVPPTHTPQFWYDINIGVMFVNLRHSGSRDVISKWLAMIEAVPEEVLNRSCTKAYVTKGKRPLFKDDQQVRRALETSGEGLCRMVGVGAE
jgi:hypothetical protein